MGPPTPRPGLEAGPWSVGPALAPAQCQSGAELSSAVPPVSGESESWPRGGQTHMRFVSSVVSKSGSLGRRMLFLHVLRDLFADGFRTVFINTVLCRGFFLS